MKRFLSVLAVALLALGGTAMAGTITFNNPGSPGIAAMSPGSSFTSGAFTVTEWSFSHVEDPVTMTNNGFTDGNPFDDFGTTVVITLTGGGLFDLTSIDVGNRLNNGTTAVGCGGGWRIEVDKNN